MTIYAPSQTADWTACPVYWELTRRQGWRLRRVDKRQMAMLFGTVAHDVLAHYNTKHTLGECLQRAEDASQIAVSDLVDNYGCTFEEADPIEWLTVRAQKLIKGYHAADPLPPTWKIEHVELEFPNHGNARMDLGGVGPEGRFVADYKTKLYLGSDYLGKTKEEYTLSPRMLHYVWAYEALTREPVPFYYIILIVLEPRFAVHVEPYRVPWMALERWKASAIWKWTRMDAHAAGEPSWEGEHFTKYGRCAMYDMCFGGEGGKALYTRHRDAVNLSA